MGKYMRKAKMTDDVAVMDVSQSSLGVRTRAKTLALQRLQKATKTTTPPPPPPQNLEELSYLQLRSRRLQKPLLKQSTCCRQNPDPKNPCQNPNPRTSSRLRLSSDNLDSLGSGPISNFSNKEGFLGKTQDDETEDDCDLGTTEASFGENNLEVEGRERSTRESTPCSLIMDSNTLRTTPGSSTKPINLSAANQRISSSIQKIMPTAQEIEEFFTGVEQEQHGLFAEKYNFDFANEMPLVGRYEWVKVQP